MLIISKSFAKYDYWRHLLKKENVMSMTIHTGRLLAELTQTNRTATDSGSLDAAASFSCFACNKCSEINDDDDKLSYRKQITRTLQWKSVAQFYKKWHLERFAMGERSSKNALFDQPHTLTTSEL